MFKDLFISYGRRESLGFVARLHQKIKLAGYEAWFDKANIPDGEDYAVRIAHGIESAHNFVYVMAPRALSSPYCLIELEYARVLGKRVIPINQAVIFQVKDSLLSEADQQVLQQFYSFHGIADPEIKTTQQVLERSLALIGRTDWLDAKENISNEACEALANWAQTYENQWHKHESLEYLQSLELPQFGETIDSLDSVIERLVLVLERHQYYVSQHTLLTTQALEWSRNQSLNHYLLVGKERQAAEEWLLVKFQEGEQAPCAPCDLLCDFICESRKNAENRMTDCFICYDYEDKATRDVVIKALARHAITTWRHDNDIQRGSKADQAILSGIAGADNVVYFISPDALVSEACNQELAHAREFNKRIIPLLIKETPNLPVELQQLQYIHFLENPQHGLAELLRVLHIDNHYYEQHKMLLARALEWQAGAAKTSFLLRGYNLENAKTWLRLNKQREQHAPTALHIEFITASEAAKERLGTEVFLSYSRKDGDFARKLNRTLQESGKTVWFDQESISSGANFEIELYKGIQNSDNFLFVISPDSVTSPYCESEVNYAAQQGKRVISVLCRETDASRLPEALKFINWIDFAQQNFDKQFPELIQTLELDREHAHQHTVLQQRANEWLDNQESHDFLLNISACENAERWLDAASDKQPRVTELQGRYIKASREAIEAARRKEQRRQRIVLGSVLMGLVIALVLAGFAWEKSEEAEKEKVEALKQTQKAKINSRANIADKLIAQGDYTRALRVAQEAYELNPNPQEPIPIISQVVDEIYSAVVLDKKASLYQKSYSFFNTYQSSPNQQLKVFYTDGENTAELTTEKGEKRVLDHGSSIKFVTFSSDSNFILTAGSNGSVNLWDNEGLLIKSLLKGLENGLCPLNTLLFGNNRLSIGMLCQDNKSKRSYSNLLLWDMQGNLLKSKEIEIDVTISDYMKMNGIASQDGRHVVNISTEENKWRITPWLTETLQFSPVISYPCLKSPSCKLTGSRPAPGLTPDGQVLLAYWESTIYLFRLNKPHEQEPIIFQNPEQNKVTALAVAPDGKHFTSADSKGNIFIWDMESGKYALFADGVTVSNMIYSKDGKKLLVTHTDATLRLWTLDKDFKRDKEALIIYTRHQGEINTQFLEDEHSIKTSSFNDGTTKVWLIPSDEADRITPLLPSVIADSLSTDKNKLLLVLDGVGVRVVQLWSLDQGKELYHYLWHDDENKNIGLTYVGLGSDDKEFISYGEDDFLRVHTLENGKVVRKWKSNYCSSGKQCLSLNVRSSDNFIVAKTEQNEIITWSMTGELVHHFSAKEVKEDHLWFYTSRDDKPLIIRGTNTAGEVLAYTIQGKLISRFLTGEKNPKNPMIYQISPDAKHLITSSNDGVKIRDFSGKILLVLPSNFLSCDFLPDAEHVIASAPASSTSGPTTKIFSITDKNEPAIELKGGSTEVKLVRFSPNGEYIMTISYDNTVKVWTRQGRLVRTLPRYEGKMYDATYTENYIVTMTTSNEGNTIRIWPSTQKIYEWAKNNKDIYQLTQKDREELGMIEEE